MSRSAITRRELQKIALLRQQYRQVTTQQYAIQNGIYYSTNSLHNGVGNLGGGSSSITGIGEFIEQEEEGQRRESKANEIPIYGNTTTYNLNSMLYENIMRSSYFKSLYELKTYHEVVDEIYNRVDHAEPLSSGTSRIPSSCFCLLVKFCTMRLTFKQVQGLLKHQDSPYIRCIGFLYLRFVCNPEELWKWFSPYLDDEEKFTAGADPENFTTIGEYSRKLLEDQNYYGTRLPRIPKKVEDQIRVNLLLWERKKSREAENLKYKDTLKVGMKVRAMYSDEENAPAMYDAVIDAIEENNMYMVTFPEYGNTELVELGDIEFDIPSKRATEERKPRKEESRSRSVSRKERRHSRSRSRRRSSYRRSRSNERPKSKSRDRSLTNQRRGTYHDRNESHNSLTEDLLAEVRQKERLKAEARGRDYARCPASYKGSLTLKPDRYTIRKRSRSPLHHKELNRDRPRQSHEEEKPKQEDSNAEDHAKKQKELEAAKLAAERMKKLREVYGDSALPKNQ